MEKKITEVVASTIFISVAFLILGIAIDYGVGKYIVAIQNPLLPDNYKQLINRFLFLIPFSFPALFYISLITINLSAEGNFKYGYVFTSIINISFIFFSVVLYRTNIWNNDSGSLRIVDVISTAIFFSTLLTAIILCIMFEYDKRRAVSYYKIRWKYFRINFVYVKQIFELSLSAIIRRSAGFITIFITNLALQYVPVPKNSLSNMNALPNNSIYWQFITSAIQPIITVVYSGIAGCARTVRFMGSWHNTRGNYKKLEEIYRKGPVLVMLYTIPCTILLMVFAPEILQLFGIHDNAQFSFINHNLNAVTLTAYQIHEQATLILRITAITLFLYTMQSVCISYTWIYHLPWKSMFFVCLRNILLEIPIIFIFAKISQATDNWTVIWFGYNLMDILAGIVFIFSWWHFLKKIRKKVIMSENIKKKAVVNG